jgi:hypothetical protein
LKLIPKIRKKKQAWSEQNTKHLAEIESFNNSQRKKHQIYLTVQRCQTTLFDFGFSSNELNIFVEALKPAELKEVATLPEPDYIPTHEILEKIDLANDQLRAYDSYIRDLQTYENWVNEGKQARENFNKLDESVKAIEAKKLEIIKNANMPAEFEITNDGILYKGFELSDSQISTSAKYIAALKLGALCLGELQTMHFDASFLDNESLKEVRNWASENDYQLLIERPDYDGGEIRYNLISEL